MAKKQGKPELVTEDLLGVEIMRVGTHPGTGCPVGGCEITEEMLDGIVKTYKSTKAEFQPPAKLGHDGEQKLLQNDGYPAAGWLSNIRREGENLIADIMKVPKVLAELIDVGAYRTRSCELNYEYTIGDNIYEIALTGLAFLGEDIPAVKGLKDIAKLYQAQKLSMPDNAQAIVFTADKKLDFALPKGMSYNEMNERLIEAFCSANPAAEPYNCWINDLFEDYAILNLGGKFWKQGYESSNDGVSLKGLPSEVERKTRWEPSKGDRYAEEASRLLVDVKAFMDRTQALVSLKTEGDGKPLSETRVSLIEGVRDTLSEAVTTLAKIPTKPAPKTDNRLKMRQAIVQAELSLASLRE